MELKIKKVTDKLNLDVEGQWNCNSSTNCRVANYTDGPSIPTTGGSAIEMGCISRITGYSYTTQGWSIF